MKKLIHLVFVVLLHACGQAPAGGNPVGANAGIAGKGGSTARFAIVEDRLYTLAGSQLITFSLEKPEEPVALNQMQVAWDVETMFPYDRSLYLGASTGMYIYDLNDPDVPTLLGQHTHQRACDPVVVQGNNAFVTLKAGNRCGGSENVLEVVDVSERERPRRISKVPMFAPTGLAIDGQQLFVCDGAAGLKVFDVADPLDLKLTDTLLGQNCNDLIPHQGLLIATTDSGIWQYRNEQGRLELLSILPWKGPP
ncbi:MAG TPA: hypothetical protein VE954_16350 [Oligoflexus sp.]|uniref:LVIVD repeat-containing protein n=1 Tax=Oligoflexus sp. TaxID=1971216 RepID=UPI002D41EBD1|nr:hypothetical protein [Oligoflexus sp.]HYX34670.1 hypothetical protein [Oligoflexus sp.]